MNAIDFQNAVLNTFKKHFPNGYANASKYPLGGGVHFSFGLIGKKDDLPNGYRENDHLRLSFGIHENFTFNSNDNIEHKLVIEVQSNTISVKPTSKYYAMSSVKLPVRKITDTPEGIIKKLDKAFAKCADTIRKEIANNNLYNQEEIDPMYLKI